MTLREWLRKAASRTRDALLSLHLPVSGGFWLTVSAVSPFISLTLLYLLWNWLSDSHSGLRTEANVVEFYSWLNDDESPSTTLRNVGFIIAGLIALPLTIWRSLVADRQASAAQRQSDTARRQADIAQRGLLSERYEQGCSRLGSDALAVCVDGIDVLERLAREHPTEYHVQVVKRLSLFVRTSVNLPRLHEEVRAAMAAIGSRSEGDVRLESNESFELNLSGSNLQNVHLAHLNLSGANLMNANLSGADLWDVDLSDARLQRANLEGACLIGANLSGTQFSLGEGDYPAAGVTQTQLDAALSYSDNPPKLGGVLDAESGEQLNPPTEEPGWLERLRELADALQQDQSRTE